MTEAIPCPPTCAEILGGMFDYALHRELLRAREAWRFARDVRAIDGETVDADSYLEARGLVDLSREFVNRVFSYNCRAANGNYDQGDTIWRGLLSKGNMLEARLSAFASLKIHFDYSNPIPRVIYAQSRETVFNPDPQ